MPVPKTQPKDMRSIDVAPRMPLILAFPYPGKGHINPMFHFCNYLVSKGIKVTFIHTTPTIKSMKSNASSLINIETISDGHEENNAKNVESYFEEFRIAATRGLMNVIDKHKMSNHPPMVLLYDSTMPWVLDVAHGHGLRGACFFTQSASVSAICYHMLQGTIKMESTTISVPLMPPMESKDLPDFQYSLDPSPFLKNHLLAQFSNVSNVDYILFNTFDKLEDEVTSWMASKWPVKTIGPLGPSVYQDKQTKMVTENNVYLFETNAEACLKWLDSKATGSVIYVSFGSLMSLTVEQMEEIAAALVKSDRYFLWVVREEEEPKLPKTFKSVTSKKGLILKWCPQIDVLAHRAVACFMTHCGWNSTLEALRSGVPMIAVPQFVDQTTNSKFIADVWRAGVRALVDEKGIVTCEEIERCVGEIIESKNGEELKRNAIKWKKLSKEAMEEGGSSASNMEGFASMLLSLK